MNYFYLLNLLFPKHTHTRPAVSGIKLNEYTPPLVSECTHTGLAHPSSFSSCVCSVECLHQQKVPQKTQLAFRNFFTPDSNSRWTVCGGGLLLMTVYQNQHGTEWHWNKLKTTAQECLHIQPMIAPQLVHLKGGRNTREHSSLCLCRVCVAVSRLDRMLGTRVDYILLVKW